MNKYLLFIQRAPFLGGLIACMLSPLPAFSQATGFLQLTAVQVVEDSPVEIVFFDAGTGATNYIVEFTIAMTGDNVWIDLPEAVITPQGNGFFHASVPYLGSDIGFYRVRGLGGAIPVVTASFNSTAFEVAEGGMIAPVIEFSGPYYGTIRYTIGGTAASGDYQSLSGVVNVAGTSALLPIGIADNALIGQLKHLTLTLEAGPGILLGSGSETIVTILENDAAWKGSFMTGSGLLGFVMTLRQTGGTYSATLRGELPGLFPTSDVPVSLQWSENEFLAAALDIPIPPEATLLGLPIQLSLQLQAVNGAPDQSVGPTQIEGTGRLISTVPGKPFLSATNGGRFLLLRPPSAPSTNEIDLVNVN